MHEMDDRASEGVVSISLRVAAETRNT